ADTAALARDSRLGDSLALARGSIVRVGEILWLWLRHDDAYALLSLDVTRSGSVLRQTFETVRTTGGEELRLISSTEDLARAPGNSLLYLDRRTARLWKIGPLGEATPLADVGDPPATLSAPSLDDRGRLVMFAPDPPMPAEQPLIPATRPTTDYPALIILDADGQRTLLGRNTFAAPDKINIRTLAPPQLFRDRAGWLAYDPQTGELLRIKLVER
ncbi:MAG: hypothetical protein JWN40_3071, partial [Phycisphaerales bacterium]|nr:hypothetical protein [Phycisphaerales bacterium]